MDWLIYVGSVALALTAIWAVGRPLVKWARRVGHKVNRAFDVVLGTPEVVDPDRPGQVLREAVPDIGQRVTRVEDALVRIVERAERAAERSAAASERAAASAHQASVDARSAMEAVGRLTAAQVKPEGASS